MVHRGEKLVKQHFEEIVSVYLSVDNWSYVPWRSDRNYYFFEYDLATFWELITANRGQK